MLKISVSYFAPVLSKVVWGNTKCKIGTQELGFHFISKRFYFQILFHHECFKSYVYCLSRVKTKFWHPHILGQHSHACKEIYALCFAQNWLGMGLIKHFNLNPIVSVEKLVSMVVVQ